MQDFDVVIIGGGPGGLAAAKGAYKAGAKSILLLERENCTGGVLNQCIHDGFGLIRYKKQLTGPEYAERALAEAQSEALTVKTGYIATSISEDKVVTAISREGLEKFRAKSIVLAQGCRERTRGAIQTPGTRPAGVFTAGVAQNLLNTKNIMVGKNIVILGSGDIGLIMARRLTLEGAKVHAVVEIMDKPMGLARNISQCLYDFGIPLYLGHTVSRITGMDRLDGIEVSKVDENKQIVKDSAFFIPCDTLILSVGLIPENEVSQTAGVKLERSNAVITDKHLMTSVPGIFSCGNSRRVMDLADFVSMQGELAGANAACYACSKEMGEWAEELSNSMKKGLPEEGALTCSLCPNGCTIRQNPDGTLIGNRCKRGAAFYLQEVKSPERILTSTVKLNGGEIPLVPVRSDRPVKLSELPAIVKQLSSVVLDAPVKAGQIVLEGVGENGVTIVTQKAQN